MKKKQTIPSIDRLLRPTPIKEYRHNTVTTYNLYIQSQTGHVFNKTDADKDVSIKEIKLESDDESCLTKVAFSRCCPDVDQGEEYLTEWGLHAQDSAGTEYLIIWRFPAIKGEELADDEWPWHDTAYIERVVAI